MRKFENLTKKKTIFAILFVIALQLSAKTIETDICIYGGTSAGIISAVSAHRLGKKALIIEPSNYLGGLTTSGLGETDIGNKFAVTGISRDFYRQLGKHYGEFEMWKFEPHVALTVFNNYLKDTQVELIKNYELTSVFKCKGKIEFVEFTCTTNKTSEVIKVKAKMFIDATYEGDLMAKAGVSYMLGREDNSLYGETINGVQLKEKHQFPDGISPYTVPNDSNSGLCYGIQNEILQPNGTGDNKMQAYNFRFCLTQNKNNFISVTAPADYDPSKYELLKRVIAQRIGLGWKHILKSYLLINEMPNGKTDINNMGPFSTDFIGENWNYIEADFKTRKKIAKAHENYIKGLLFFLGNDSSVPAELRNEMKSWGYAKDEFTDNGGFPHQMYVREGRRMIGEYVMTEHNCLGKTTVKDGIGLAAYTMDSHNCQRIVVNGMVKNEGDVQIGGFPPYPISYRSIVPQSKECTNLLVPVSLSATHIAFGSIRMEPVFMVLAQSAAVAASMAIDANVDVQKINLKQLQKTLSINPLLNGTNPEILIDNSDQKNIKVTGNWATTIMKNVSYKMDYLMVQADSNVVNSIIFAPEITQSDVYSVYFYCPEKPKDAPQWAASVTLKVFDGKNSHQIIVNQEKHRHHWVKMGEYKMEAKSKPTIEVIADKTGVAIADAFIFVPNK
jgi:ribulose 1,5-bisphosphate synthetase/thiazole synthase